MPFKSDKQRAFMFANHPKIAKKFQAETPMEKPLPMYHKLTTRMNTLHAPKMPSMGTEVTDGFTDKKKKGY